MKKIKKVLFSWGAMMGAMFSKVFASNINPRTWIPPVEPLYGVQPAYGVRPIPAEIEATIAIAQVLLVYIIVPITGIKVLLNKKLTKKAKAIIVTSVLIGGIGIFYLLRFIRSLFLKY